MPTMLAGALVVVAALHLGYQALLWWGLRRLARRLPPPPPTPWPAISVVVAARNQANNLPKLLDALRAQAYPGPWEVLVVDDRSTDGSWAWLHQQQRHTPWLRPLRLNASAPGWAGKKWALRVGLAAARYPHLALTDADCTPGPQWLAALGAAFAGGAALVVGASPVQGGNAWPGRLAAYGAHQTAVQYLGWAGLGRPYMAVGRNWGYTRRWWRTTTRFAPHRTNPSGDDDLLFAHHAPGQPVAILTNPQASAPTHAPTTWAAWARQRRRHLGAAPAYPARAQLQAGLGGTLALAVCMGGGLALAMGAWLPVGLVGMAWWALHQAQSAQLRSFTDFSNETLPETLAWPLLAPAYALAPVALARKPPHQQPTPAPPFANAHPSHGPRQRPQRPQRPR